MKQTIALTILLGMGAITAYAQVQHEIRLYRTDEGHMGLILRDVTQADVLDLQLPRETGVYVELLGEDTPASRAGMQKGDIILEYATLPILSVKHFQRLVLDTPASREVELSVFRSGRYLKTTISVGKRRRTTPLDVSRRTPSVPAWDGPDIRFRTQPGQSGSHFFFFSERPRLGITGGNLTEQLADFLGISGKKGVLVAEVLENTPAQRAGLKAGDAIVSVDGHPVDSLSELSSLLKDDTHEVEIVRDKRVEKVTLELEPREVTGTRF